MRRLILLSLFLFPYAVSAQTGLSGFNSQTFQPNFDGQGILHTIGSKSLPKWHSSMGTQLNMNYKSLTANQLSSGTTNDAIVSQITTDFYYALGLPADVTAGLAIPVIFDQRGTNVVTTGGYTSSGVGDAIFSAKWCFLCFLVDEENLSGWKAALASRTFLPTGTQAEFTGSSEITQDFLLTVDKKWESAEAGLNAGYRVASYDQFPGGEHDDEILFSIATRLPLKAIQGSWVFVGDLHGAIMTREYRKANMPMEVLLGFEKKYPDGISFNFGFGERLFSALAVPHHRAFLGIRYSYQ